KSEGHDRLGSQWTTPPTPPLSFAGSSPTPTTNADGSPTQPTWPTTATTGRDSRPMDSIELLNFVLHDLRQPGSLFVVENDPGRAEGDSPVELLDNHLFD